MAHTEFNVPNDRNYIVSAGAQCWIAKFDANDVLGDYLPVGNIAEDPEMTFELERLENMTNQFGLDL